MAVSRMHDVKYAIWPLLVAESPTNSAMGQTPCSTERISFCYSYLKLHMFKLHILRLYKMYKSSVQIRLYIHSVNVTTNYVIRMVRKLLLACKALLNFCASSDGGMYPPDTSRGTPFSPIMKTQGTITTGSGKIHVSGKYVYCCEPTLLTFLKQKKSKDNTTYINYKQGDNDII